MHKEELTKTHDVFLESLFEKGSYTKLYSYTHLLNGFAVYAKGDEVHYIYCLINISMSCHRVSVV